MEELKKALDAPVREQWIIVDYLYLQGHCLLEMPSGTGKTVSLLSLVVAYMNKYRDRLQKLIYCSRTIPEIEKCVEELRKLFAYYQSMNAVSTSLQRYVRTVGIQPLDFLALALSARKNLCINESVVSMRLGTAVDAGCQRLTASFMRARRRLQPELPCCPYFEKLDEQRDTALPKGVYNLVGAASREPRCTELLV